MKPISDVREAVRLVDGFTGDPTSFELPIDDALQDPIGINMALVLDHALRRGWWPDGYTQEHGFRIYRYKAAS
jgi:hypothetical protein